MFRNYFKVAIRNLKRHPAYACINILGLAIGITCCTLIMLFVKSELSFDRFHTKSDRIYRAWLHEHSDQQDYINTVTPLPMGGALEANIPEVESSCRVLALNSLVKNDKESFNENVRMVDTSFFKIFDFNLLEGDLHHPFTSASSVILSKSTAIKYFGTASPIGKTLELQLDENLVSFIVSGVTDDCPEASSIQYKLLIPFSNAHYLFTDRQLQAWHQVFSETYVLLKKDVSARQATAKFPSMMKQIGGDSYQPGEYMINLQPLTSIHLDTSLPAGNEPISSPVYSYILSVIGLLILMIACINFITLSIGRSTSRAMEVGVRKVLGAERHQLVKQFWGEAFLITMVSAFIGLAATLVLIHPFNQLINRQLSFAFDPVFVLYCLAILFMIGLFAGMYPAIILSGFKPIEALKGKVKAVNKIGVLRRTLIVGQFVASIGMIICTLLAGQQLHFIEDKDLGYQKDHVIVVSTNKDGAAASQLARIYSNRLKNNPEVQDASVSIFTFSEIPWAGVGYEDPEKKYREFVSNQVDAEFVKTMGIRIVSGKNFSDDNPGDEATGILVNESLVKEYGWADPIGKMLPGKFNMHVIGVMKDFNYESLHTKIKPLALAIHLDSILTHADDVNFAYAPQPRISVHLYPGNLTAQVEGLRTAWKSIAADQDFDFHFLDESIAAQYKQEQRTNAIIRIASVISVVIACLGLFGLVTLVVTQRTREIGIRKILGAKISDIISLLSRDFALMILIASAIAAPLAWYGMNQWLHDFEYRIQIRWWVFLLATVAALLVALFTVSIQALKAALANPVRSLRAE